MTSYPPIIREGSEGILAHWLGGVVAGGGGAIRRYLPIPI